MFDRALPTIRQLMISIDGQQIGPVERFSVVTDSQLYRSAASLINVVPYTNTIKFTRIITDSRLVSDSMDMQLLPTTFSMTVWRPDKVVIFKKCMFQTIERTFEDGRLVENVVIMSLDRSEE